MIKVEYRTLTKDGFEGRKIEIEDDKLDAFLKAVGAIESHDAAMNELKEKGDNFIVNLAYPISAIILRKE